MLWGVADHPCGDLCGDSRSLLSGGQALHALKGRLQRLGCWVNIALRDDHGGMPHQSHDGERIDPRFSQTGSIGMSKRVKHEVVRKLEELPESTVLLFEKSELQGSVVVASEDESRFIDAAALEHRDHLGLSVASWTRFESGAGKEAPRTRRSGTLRPTRAM